MKKALAILAVVLLFAEFAFAKGSTEEVLVAAIDDGPVDIWAAYNPAISLTTAREITLDAPFPAGTDWANNVWYDEFASEFGIKVTNLWETPESGDAYKTKLNLAIASGDIPDFFLVKDLSQLQSLIDGDMIQELGAVYDKYASPLLKEQMEADGGKMYNTTVFGGKQMAIPVSEFNTHDARMIFIRKDWREKVGFDKPASMEDVFELSAAFANQDPDGNGIKDTFGLPINKKVLQEGFLDITGVANAYGAYPRMWIEDGKGGLSYGTMEHEMKEALGRLARMYANGEIDPEFVAKDGGALGGDITSGKFGILIGNFWIPSWPINSMFEAEDVDWEIFSVWSLKGRNAGVQIGTNAGEAFVVRKGVEHPEALLKMMNYYEEKLYGPTADEERYRMNGEYAVRLWAPVEMHGPVRVNLDQNIAVTHAIDTGDTSVLYDEEVTASYNGAKAYFDALDAGTKPAMPDWLKVKFFYGPESSMGVLNMYWDQKRFVESLFYGVPTSTMQRRDGTLRQMEEEMIVKIITGQEPLSYFDDFVSQWKSLGGDAITSEVNDWYKAKK